MTITQTKPDTTTKILDFDAFEKTPIERDPFEFMIAKGVIPASKLEEVNADYPQIDIPANFRPENLDYGPAFAQVLEDLDSAAFERLVERKFDIDLSRTTKSVTVRKLSEPSDGNIHTDHWSKVMTVLLYFNPEWRHEGGRLRMLRSKHDIEDYAAEVIPEAGTLLAFKRSNKSFHGYKRCDAERRMVQVNWVRSDPMALQAQRVSRIGTHTGKRLLRLVRGLRGDTR